MKSNSAIKTVVFDLGKVLLDFDYGIAARKLSRRSRMEPGPLAHLLSQSELIYRFETGRLSAREFFEEVRAAAGFSGSFEEFAECFSNIFTPIEPMVQLHERLRREGFRTFVFSNTNELAANHIRKTYPFFADFDGYVLSFEHGVMKPDARLYEVVERVTGCRGADLLYLDDRPENVAAGAARGWQAVLQEKPETTLTALRRLGVLNQNGAAVGGAT